MKDLELRIKLWNQLAETGQLAISEAWYETPEQMAVWNEISEREFDDPQSNAFRELAQLSELFAEQRIQRTFDDKFTMIFDLGCGNGKKGAYVIDQLKDRRTLYYVPCDTSAPLIQEALENQGRAQWDFASQTNTGAFLQKLEQNQFQWCDTFLRSYERIPVQLSKLVDNPLVQADYNDQFGGDIYGLRDSLKNAQAKADELYRQLDKLRTFKGSASELRQVYLSLYEEYNPDSARYIEAQGSKIIEFINVNEKLRKTGPLGGQAASMNIWGIGKMKTNLTRMLIDANLLPSSYAANDCGWATLPCVITHAGLQTDFIKTNCADIAFNRYNAEHIRNRVWDRFTNHQIAEHMRDNKQPPLGLFLLLGQTLGNFTQDEQKGLLKNLYLAMKPGDLLISGVEFRPEQGDPHYESKIETLIGKYNGCTAETFMRQTTRLAGINDEAVRFGAEYKDNAIQMHFEVTDPMLMVSHPLTPSRQLYLAKGTKILTATSYKFTPAEHFGRIEDAGFKVVYAPDRAELDYGILVAQR